MKIEISRTGPCVLSSKTRKRLKHVIHQSLGKNVCALHKIPIENKESHSLNGCAIYTETEGHDPKDIFQDIVVWGTNYLFGMLEIKRTYQKVFFLVDIDQPLHISEGNFIILPESDKTVVIHVK